MSKTSQPFAPSTSRVLLFGNWRREDWVYMALSVGFSPIWLPVWAVHFVCLWVITRFYVWGTIESAWSRCAKQWESHGLVEMQAPHVGTSFAHHLAVALGRSHRSKSSFFLMQLRDAKPLLAGDAFKCLIRANPNLQLKDIDSEILQRSDEIPTLWADLGDDIPFSRFVKGYFVGRHFTNGHAKKGIEDSWIQELVEIGDLSDMPLCINLRESLVTDAGLEVLASKIRMESLVLDSVAITDSGLSHLKNLSEIEFLSLSRTNISDEGLNYLKGLTTLEYLDLENNLVTPAAVDRLRMALPNCEIRA